MKRQETRPIDRIQTLFEWMKEHRVLKSRYAFEKACELSKDYVKNTLATEVGSPSVLIIAQIHETFPDVSLEWLVSGKGKMFKKAGTDEEIATTLKRRLIERLL